MERRRPPETEEGWYVLHQMWTVDWDAWRDAPSRERERAITEGVEYLRAATEVRDAEEGDSALYAIVGHKADLMIVHLRPTIADLDTLERRFEGTTFAEYADLTYSYLSVTEMSGYSKRGREYFDGELDEDSGLYRYIQSRIHPEIPAVEHVCFYPMDKRRQPEQNWYDLPFDERAEHMAAHGEVGRDYAGRVTQMIAGSIGLDDYEWGITLWADDPVAVKDLLYEMRFDPSSSEFAEFGPFYFGRRFAPEDLDSYLAGDRIPSVGDAGRGGRHAGSEDAGERAEDADEASERANERVRGEFDRLGVDLADAPEGAFGLVLSSEADVEEVREAVEGLRGNFEHYDSHVLTEVYETDDGPAIASVWTTESAADTAQGFLEDLPGVAGTVRGPLSGASEGGAERESSADPEAEAASIREALAEKGVYAGKPHGEDVFALVLYSEADPAELETAVDDLREGFDRYDTHVKTAVYEAYGGEGDADGDAVDDADADADESADDADELAVVSIWETESAAEIASDYLSDLPGITRQAGDEGDSWGTMGMFYTVKPDRRDEFVGKFETVGGLLADMPGHRRTTLMVNRDDANDTFIASRWDSKEDAMDFFRSEAFTDTVEWGRDVLADRPRHVFMA